MIIKGYPDDCIGTNCEGECFSYDWRMRLNFYDIFILD